MLRSLMPGTVFTHNHRWKKTTTTLMILILQVRNLRLRAGQEFAHGQSAPHAASPGGLCGAGPVGDNLPTLES